MKNDIRFLRESNAIEDIYDLDALIDYYEAWDQLLTYDVLTLDNILEAHQWTLHRINPRIAGKIRNCNVRVGARLCPDYTKVLPLLEAWLKVYSKAITSSGIKLAHVKFEKIHPFEDGNGRIGRMILNWQRVKAGLPILVIEAEKREAYYKWFQKVV